MPALKILHIVFEGELAPQEIPAFRGAMGHKVGAKHVLFHHHDGDDLRYAYPLIQYKRYKGQPALVCVGQGVEEIHHYFNQRDWSLTWSGRTLPMRVHKLDMRDHQVQVWEDQWFEYSLYQWLPLNQQAYREYFAIGGEEERMTYLCRKFTGNILSFAKGIDWHVEKPIKTLITGITRMRTIPFKSNQLLGFDLNIRTNVSLPWHIGLGKGASVGHGYVSGVRRGEPSADLRS